MVDLLIIVVTQGVMWFLFSSKLYIGTKICEQFSPQGILYLSIAIDIDNINVFLFIETLKAVLLLQTSQSMVVQAQA